MKSQDILAFGILALVVIAIGIIFFLWSDSSETITGTVVEAQTAQSLTSEDDEKTYYVILQKEDGSRERFKVTRSIYRQLDEGEVCTFSTRGWPELSARSMKKPSCR